MGRGELKCLCLSPSLFPNPHNLGIGICADANNMERASRAQGNAGIIFQYRIRGIAEVLRWGITLDGLLGVYNPSLWGWDGLFDREINRFGELIWCSSSDAKTLKTSKVASWGLPSLMIGRFALRAKVLGQRRKVLLVSDLLVD